MRCSAVVQIEKQRPGRWFGWFIMMASNRTMERSELVEIRVGPSTITEVYAQRVCEDGLVWEESLRKRRRRVWRPDQVGAYWLLVGTAIGAAAGLVWLLGGW